MTGPKPARILPLNGGKLEQKFNLWWTKVYSFNNLITYMQYKDHCFSTNIYILLVLRNQLGVKLLILNYWECIKWIDFLSYNFKKWFFSREPPKQTFGLRYRTFSRQFIMWNRHFSEKHRWSTTASTILLQRVIESLFRWRDAHRNEKIFISPVKSCFLCFWLRQKSHCFCLLFSSTPLP